jgi:TfoX/Sxy family transcriptional regulator of competence genes
MQDAPMTPDERYETLVEALLGQEGVTLGSEGKRGFGSAALQVGGTIFAMLSNGRLVVKLPRWRVDELIAAGAGERFDPRRDGRVMKEWLSVDPASDHDWLALAREAMSFVASTR